MVRVVIVKRVKPLPFGNILIPLLSIVMGVVLAALILYFLSGTPPVLLFVNVGMGFIQIQTLRDFLMLTMLGTALVISFTGAIWNIGEEGQITMGMMAAAYIALFTALSHMPSAAKLTMIALALVLGGLWGLIAGVLRAYLSIDEVPVTLIMNYIAYYALNYLVRGPWKGKATYGYIRTDLIPEATHFTLLPVRGVTVTYEDVALTVGIMAFAAFFLWRTATGVRLKVLGSNPDALRAAGVNVQAMIILALTISGAIAGAVGAAQLAGYLHRISYPMESHTANLGYTAILVAWLSMLDLRAVPIAAYIIGALNQAGRLVQAARLGGAAITYLFIGTTLLTFTVLRVFSEYSIRFVRGGGK